MYLVIGSDGYLGQKFCNYLEKKNIGHIKLGRRKSKALDYVSIGDDPSNLQSILNLEFSDINIHKIIYLATNKKEDLFLNVSDEDINNHLYVNHVLFLQLLKFFIQKMISHKDGNVLYVGSSKAHSGDIGSSLYSSSKAASINVLRSLSKEYGRFNIRFNALMLGYFGGKLWEQIPEEKRSQMMNEPSLNRLGTTDEFCDTAFFLLNSTYMTGEEIYLDGGLR